MIYWAKLGVLEAAELKLYRRKGKSGYWFHIQKAARHLKDFFMGWLVLLARLVTLI